MYQLVVQCLVSCECVISFMNIRTQSMYHLVVLCAVSWPLCECVVTFMNIEYVSLGRIVCGVLAFV